MSSFRGKTERGADRGRQKSRLRLLMMAENRREKDAMNCRAKYLWRDLRGERIPRIPRGDNRQKI